MLMKCCVTFRAGVGLQLLWCSSVLLYLSAAAAEWYMLLLSFPAVGSISCHHSPRTTAANYFSTGPRYYSKAAARCVFSRAILGICVLWYQRVGSCFYPFYPPLHPCAAGWECWVTAQSRPACSEVNYLTTFSFTSSSEISLFPHDLVQMCFPVSVQPGVNIWILSHSRCLVTQVEN